MQNDVILVGCGPTGGVLANLLGLRGLRVVVFERDEEVFPLPRATHFDGEIARILKSTGLWEEIAPHTAPFGPLELYEGDRRLLRTELGAEDRVFVQPRMEEALRRGLERFPHVVLRAGAAVDEVGQDAEGAWVRLGDEVHRARYVIACDGGRSRVREQLGIQMVEVHPSNRWVIVDGYLHDEADLDRLPECFRYVFGERTRILVHGLGTHRRWEFALDEDEAEPSRETVLGWVSEDLPLELIDIRRVQTYHHRALVAERWQEGRILLAGDAAHMMPPTAGQGMCAGLRDAVELAHQLAAGTPEAYPAIRERELRKTLRTTLFLSGFFQARGPLGRLLRRTRIGLLARLPILEQWIRRHRVERPEPGVALAEAEALAGV